MTSTPFSRLMIEMQQMPLWVKQVIYAQLQLELKAFLSQGSLVAFSPEHMLQLWVPEVNRQGIAELEKAGQTPPTSVIRVLQLTKLRQNVIDITVTNQWSLAQCSEALMQALSLHVILAPQSAAIMGTIEYLAGRIRLGEYLVKIGRLTVDQLDQALRTQKNIEQAMGERVGIASVLINLGYIEKEDSESILFLKEESKKAFGITSKNPV